MKARELELLELEDEEEILFPPSLLASPAARQSMDGHERTCNNNYGLACFCRGRWRTRMDSDGLERTVPTVSKPNRHIYKECVTWDCRARVCKVTHDLVSLNYVGGDSEWKQESSNERCLGNG